MSQNFDIKSLELDKILDRSALFAVSGGGKSKIEQTLPRQDLDVVKALQKQTLTAYEMAMSGGTPPMRNVSDMREQAVKASRGAVLSIHELMRVRHLLSSMHELKNYYDKSLVRSGALDSFFGCLYSYSEPQDTINRCILSEEEIADSASPRLREIRHTIMRTESNIRRKMDSIITSAAYQKYLQDPIIVQRNGRFAVPVKAEYRGSVPGLVHDTSGSGATLFIEPMAVVEMNNEIRMLISEEQEEIQKILSELSQQIGDISNDISYGYEAYTTLDSIFAKAIYGIYTKSSFPIVNDMGEFVLNRARHPLIDGDAVVPVDLSLSSEDTTLVVTGPNTGGKTVTLKTLGLFSLMAQCGFMIPAADNSKIPVFSKILADIGDEQSIEQSLSTFSSHMKRIVSIFEKADGETLVLLDELGAGTDPVEGGALAVAILERLRETGCKIAATTHYAEVKSYALRTQGIQNAGCEFDVESLRPTYRILMGVPGSSNAFSIAKRLGLSDDVIYTAQTHLDDKDKGFEEVISSLNNDKKAVEIELEKARLMGENASRKAAELEKSAQEIKSQADREIESAKKKARSIIDNVTYQARVLEDELEKIKKEKEIDVLGSLQKARSILKSKMDGIYAASDPMGDDTEDGYILPRELKVGDIVLVRSIGKNAEIKEINQKENTALVVSGAIKIRVDFSNLKLVEQPKQKKKIGKALRTTSKMIRNVSTEVDLRGMSAEEALMEVDAFIDNCVMSGIQSATVIHGIGTGVLKRVMRQHLKQHPNIESSRPGRYGEGEDGVTIVEIK